jgi:NAD(P)-dependent dehydrogenase (short-subunit alcohol dehydrogenase family)
MSWNAIITGASRGLGQAIAREFWARGATLGLVARSETALAELAAGLPPAPAQQAVTVVADLSDPEAPARIVERLRAEWGQLDVLVNNAAVLGPIGSTWETGWDEWQQALQVNLLAPIQLCRLCIPWMNRGGSIINLSGGGATGPRPRFGAYGTAKAALVRFTETLAQETAGLGIRVNAIAPGAMNTEMLEGVLRSGAERAGKEYDAALRQKQSGGEPPQKAAELAAYLASRESEPISGRLISAVWDPWRSLGTHAGELSGSDIYTLRRIVPEDRGRRWA